MVVFVVCGVLAYCVGGGGGGGGVVVQDFVLVVLLACSYCYWYI